MTGDDETQNLDGNDGLQQISSQQPTGATPGWAVLMTQTHRDAYAAENLVRQGFAVYQPQVLKRIAHARRVRELPRPLFAGYLFVEVDPRTARWRALNGTFGVRGVLRAGGQPALLSSQFIDALRAREIGGLITRPVSPLVVGDTIRVVRGPFEGTIARILDVDDRDRVVILLDLLQRTVTAPFAQSMVTKHDLPKPVPPKRS